VCNSPIFEMSNTH